MATVKYFGIIRTMTHVQEEVIEAKKVSDLLRCIKNTHGKEAYQTAKKSHIIVNSQSVATLKGYRTALEPEDVVQILPVCGGG